MINFVEEYMAPHNDTIFEDDFDEQKITLKAISKTLPIIIENELTAKQRQCLKLFYMQGKTQPEIARELKLSQPTVCRHIKVAKDIANKYLSYCLYTVKTANEQWLKLQ
ncbi:MAG: helix-turn-helix domain-containing protein [Clostridium sp.]|nr:helix-turn-helix domain-containing protein [Clostridium sp.]